MFFRFLNLVFYKFYVIIMESSDRYLDEYSVFFFSRKFCSSFCSFFLSSFQFFFLSFLFPSLFHNYLLYLQFVMYLFMYLFHMYLLLFSIYVVNSCSWFQFDCKNVVLPLLILGANQVLKGCLDWTVQLLVSASGWLVLMSLLRR